MTVVFGFLQDAVCRVGSLKGGPRASGCPLEVQRASVTASAQDGGVAPSKVPSEEGAKEGKSSQIPNHTGTSHGSKDGDREGWWALARLQVVTELSHFVLLRVKKQLLSESHGPALSDSGPAPRATERHSCHWSVRGAAD